MADKIVTLEDKNNNNLYPVAGALFQNAVTTASIQDGAVTTDKIATSQVTTPKIANQAVTSDKIDFKTLGWVVLYGNTSVSGVGQTSSLIINSKVISSAKGDDLGTIDTKGYIVNFTGTVIASGTCYMTCNGQSYAGISIWRNNNWEMQQRQYTASGNQSIQLPMCIIRVQPNDIIGIVGGASGAYTLGNADPTVNRLNLIFLPD